MDDLKYCMAVILPLVYTLTEQSLQSLLKMPKLSAASKSETALNCKWIL